ncbi:MAG: LysR family transcriptional regulator [Luteolibacter sp.]
MDRIEIREIECFMAVAENLSFSKAARQLHMTQPPLSRQIRKLEEKLGVTLFLRNNQRVELTAEGEIFYGEAIPLLHHTDRLVDTVRLARTGKREVFNVGFLGALLDEEMVVLLKKFQKRLPGCQVRAHEVTLEAVVPCLQNREVDGVFISSATDVRGEELGMMQWRIPHYKVLIPSHHPLAKNAEIRLKDLAEENWVMISRRSAPSFRKRLIEACLKEGFHPKIIHESDRLPAILTMVALGEGIALMSHSKLVVSLPHLVLRPLVGWASKIEHTFVYRKEDSPPALVEFRKLLAEEKQAREKRAAR